MAQCRHENVTILEEYVTFSVHVFDKGVYSHSNSDAGEGVYTGAIVIQCPDCHFCKRYRSETTLPRWAKFKWIAVEERKAEEWQRLAGTQPRTQSPE